MNTNTEIQTTTQISCNEKTATVCTVTYKKALPQKTPGGTAKKTSSKRQGKWIFNVPGERVKLVADSRQARSMVGMLSDFQDLLDLLDDFGRRVIRFHKIISRPKLLALLNVFILAEIGQQNYRDIF